MTAFSMRCASGPFYPILRQEIRLTFVLPRLRELHREEEHDQDGSHHRLGLQLEERLLRHHRRRRH